MTIRTAAARWLGVVSAELAGPCLDAGAVPECSEGGDAGTGVAVVGNIRLGRVWLPDRPGWVRWFRLQRSGSQRHRVAHAEAFARRPRLLVVGGPTSALGAAVPRLVLS